MDAELREEERRYTLGFDWQYADESDGGPSELLERRAGVNGKVDFFLDDRSYLLMTSDIETDDKAQLDLRYSAGVGYGYQVAEDEDWSLSFEAGLKLSSRPPFHSEKKGRAPSLVSAAFFQR